MVVSGAHSRWFSGFFCAQIYTHPQPSVVFFLNNQTTKMVKQKNHTARNATYKAHRNGIKEGVKQRYMAQKGVSVYIFFCPIIRFCFLNRAAPLLQAGLLASRRTTFSGPSCRSSTISPLCACRWVVDCCLAALPTLPPQPALRQAEPAPAQDGTRGRRRGESCECWKLSLHLTRASSALLDCARLYRLL